MRAFALLICDIPLPSDAACAGAHSPEATVANCSTYAIFLPKNAFFSKKICVCAIFVVPLHPLSEKNAYFGTLPERLGIGLQNRGRRFESARYLLEKSRSVEWLFLLDALQADGRLRLLDIGRPLG